jgi:hypothetical protein
MIDASSEASGWIAAIVSCVSFGSFAVPIKSPTCQRIDVDPLVFQTYKTAMCLLTSWLVLLLPLPSGQTQGDESHDNQSQGIQHQHVGFYFTPWGIISGLFWVPAGVAAIYAVKNAGLAVSQGLWSSIIVMVSFTWGIFIFQEQVKSIFGSIVSVFLMIVGLWGMSFYSSPDGSNVTATAVDVSFRNYEQVHSMNSLVDVVPSTTRADDNNNGDNNGDNVYDYDYDNDTAAFSQVTNHISLSPRRRTTQQQQNNYEVVHSPPDNDGNGATNNNNNNSDNNNSNDYDYDISIGNDTSNGDNDHDDHTDEDLSYNSSMTPTNNNNNNITIVDDDDCFLPNPSTPISLIEAQNQVQNQRSYSRRTTIVSKRTMGLLAAIFNGVWGGSIMVPMHYAPERAHGIGYVISFAIGATIITICLWIVRIGYIYFGYGNEYEYGYGYGCGEGTRMTLRRTIQTLPKFHFHVMWKPGGIAGLLWSIGNLSSMISVQHLGEGVGYSLTQASMLVSGMWGIFYFHEVEGVVIRIKWFISALITIVGILLLSFEHVKD